MPPTAAAGFWSRVRACAGAVRRGLGGPSRLAASLAWLAASLAWLAASLVWFASGLVLFGSMCSGIAQAADPIKGEASFAEAGGYARLVLKLAEDVDSEVSVAGSIIVIRFKRPVDIPIDAVPEAVPDYVASARRDPDGSAIRLSLARRVTINTMTAGERVFIDLLPDSWKGPPPALPIEVIRELSERARNAERALRQQRATAEVKKRAPIRVRASVQPTFVRFIFEMPDGVGVSSALNDQKLTLSFSAGLAFDLADAKLAAPSNVASINQKFDGDTSAVEIALIGDVDVHSFREDKNYMVDVAFQQSEKPSALLSPAPDAAHALAIAAPAPTAPAPATPATIAPASMAPVPADPAVTAPPVSATPAGEPALPGRSGEAAPPKPAGIDAKSAPAPKVALAAEAPKPAPPAPEAPVAPPEKPAKMAIPEPSAATKGGDRAGSVDVKRDSGGLRLSFSFAAATPAALFRHADSVWLVFDSVKPIDIEPIRTGGGALIAEASLMPLEKGQAIRIRLNQPQMPSLTGEDQAAGANWTLTFADAMATPAQPLTAMRNISDPAHANVSVSLPGHGRVHRLVDPDAGDSLLVVTAPPPVRGFIREQDFVELTLLESIHGIAVRLNSDDIATEIAPDKIILGRPGGLTLSPADSAPERASTVARPIFDIGEWRKNQGENFLARERELVAAAVAAGPDQRTAARVDLARFYLARAMYPEAKGVLDLVLADTRRGQEDPVSLIVHSVASALMDRPDLALKDLANPAIGANFDSQLWKALAVAREGKWAEAREKFKNVEFAITSLPIDLQRIVIMEALRAALEVKDYSGAAKRAADLEVIGVLPEQKPAFSVLRGRLAEALGHDKDALGEYRMAVNSENRAAAAEGKAFEIALRQKHDEISPADALRELETLSVMWRGDGIEVRALVMMARLYADAGRFGEALAADRTATRLQPNSEISRQGQDESAALFAQLFLGSKGDDLPPVDALGLFYEYRELTPIGRRGDEMIRRLADRLVAVDLLDQASELLQYQVDHRLEGAARAQVAARLAMVYLTNRKPDRAIAALRTTRIADLAGEVRQQRLLLEARAQSDIGRHDLALDIISNIGGREAIRLRSDIYWASRRWREASEQIELYYADRWRNFKPLNPVEKGDVIRALVGYALAQDAIGLTRFREKYAPLMSGDEDRAAFETASQPADADTAEFAPIAKMAASVDTLDGFLREMRTRFPDASAKATLPPGTPKSDPATTGSLPEIVGSKRVQAQAAR
jgi:hypothetical protein